MYNYIFIILTSKSTQNNVHVFTRFLFCFSVLKHRMKCWRDVRVSVVFLHSTSCLYKQCSERLIPLQYYTHTIYTNVSAWWEPFCDSLSDFMSLCHFGHSFVLFIAYINSVWRPARNINKWRNYTIRIHMNIFYAYQSSFWQTPLSFWRSNTFMKTKYFNDHVLWLRKIIATCNHTTNTIQRIIFC